MNPLAFLTIHKLTFIEKRHEGANVYSFFFSAKKPLSWKAGQHFIFWLPAKNLNLREQLRAFSVSSAPSEGVIRITTRYFADTGSDFKKRLSAMEPGAHIYSTGALMDFHLKAGARHVGIVGGIGVTPLRSMLTQMAAEGNSVSFTLYYQNAAAPIIFKDEFDAISREHPNIVINYLMDPEAVDRARLTRDVPDPTSCQYYLSGSPGFIKAMEGVLIEGLGVSPEKITQDGFWDFRERLTSIWGSIFSG